MDHAEARFAKKAHLSGLLEQICCALDLTQEQYRRAEASYGAVSEWLASSPTAALRNSSIYSHGSIRLMTANRPLRNDEFDVDLVSPMKASRDMTPAMAKRLLGERLREHDRYRPLLEEKRRCWRINYAGEFHLDITPTVPNPYCANGGELVPDKEAGAWKPTHPRGYAELFDRRAAVRPRFYLPESLEKYRADIEPLPQRTAPKGLLRRIVQLLKRDRDIYFLNRNGELAPISIIMTTLASRAYANVIGRTFDSEFDVLQAVIDEMPRFIEVRDLGGRRVYVVENETTTNENFADKWNKDGRLAVAFFDWHRSAGDRLKALEKDSGTDTLRKSLAESFGDGVVARVMDQYTQRISQTRASGGLRVAPVGITAAAATSVRAQTHTFHGDTES